MLIAAYNPDAGYLAAAVRSALGQTIEALEVIVIDDGSAQPIVDALDRADDRVRLIRHPVNRGLSAARNTGLRHARAPLISILDSDDEWEPRYLERVLPRLADPAVGLVYTNASIVEHPDGLDSYIRDPAPHPIDSFPLLAEANPVPNLTATARTAAVRALGGYSRWMRHAPDYQLWCKLAFAGWSFAYVDEPLARFRWPATPRSMSFDSRRMDRYLLLMWAGFALRHPRVPGPRRALIRRLRSELTRHRPPAVT